MKILFWNLKKNPNEKWVTGIIQENDIDIALFAEYTETKFKNVLLILGEEYKHHDGFGACEKITLLCKQNIETKVRREQNRYTLYSCEKHALLYNIVGIHLPAKPRADSNDRKNIIRDIVRDTCEQEKELKSKCTIIIGDFNCNPFDEEVIEKDAFNAVLFKPIIRKNETIIYNNKEYRRFYNPILHYLSEDTSTYGSYYYSSGSAPLYWNSLDQILVRSVLIDKIESLNYIKSIKGKDLIKECKPNELISDHLPLLVEFKEGV